MDMVNLNVKEFFFTQENVRILSRKLIRFAVSAHLDSINFGLKEKKLKFPRMISPVEFNVPLLLRREEATTFQHTLLYFDKYSHVHHEGSAEASSPKIREDDGG